MPDHGRQPPCPLRCDGVASQVKVHEGAALLHAPRQPASSFISDAIPGEVEVHQAGAFAQRNCKETCALISNVVLPEIEMNERNTRSKNCRQPLCSIVPDSIPQEVEVTKRTGEHGGDGHCHAIEQRVDRQNLSPARHAQEDRLVAMPEARQVLAHNEGVDAGRLRSRSFALEDDSLDKRWQLLAQPLARPHAHHHALPRPHAPEEGSWQS
mmetsp:Transcript_34462/g.71112  ORF Transcript_34462/g.71112 Transcript_34462/m.71112 type:complete len:211 (-) Transcript_34462:242-874(-)